MALTWQDLDDMVEGDPLVLRDRAWDEIERLRGELAAAESTIQALENPELRAALTSETTGDYGPVPPPSR